MQPPIELLLINFFLQTKRDRAPPLSSRGYVSQGAAEIVTRNRLSCGPQSVVALNGRSQDNPLSRIPLIAWTRKFSRTEETTLLFLSQKDVRTVEGRPLDAFPFNAYHVLFEQGAAARLWLLLRPP